jgi:putative ABC transport system permease protein
MSWARLVWRNLWYHWRGNLAVLLGVAVGTAVLTGALLVGDSLRGSLRDRALNQLGWVDDALISGRFIRASLASDLGAKHAAAAILVPGAASVDRPDGKVRATRISLLGVGPGFWQNAIPVDESFWNSAREEVVLNRALASDLGVQAGDALTFNLQKVSLIPRETLLGHRNSDEVIDEIRLTVKAVLADEGMARFNLNPSTAAPRNAFVPIKLLQNRLKQADRANALLVAGAPAELGQNLRKLLTLEDWGLVLYDPAIRTNQLFEKLNRNHNGKLTLPEYRRRMAEAVVKEMDANKDGTLDRAEVLAYYQKAHPYLSLESRQMLLEPFIARAAQSVADEMKLRSAPTLVYLANTIADGNKSIPYSVVAALDPGLAAPLGPFLPADSAQLKDGEILLADWRESPLAAKPGDDISLVYYPPVHEGLLREEAAHFKLRALIPMAGAALDPDITPDFPGITDKLDIRDWNPPFPYDNKRVTKADERYWDEFRTTPKAYVTLADGERLWGSRFGDLTSIRLAATNSADDLDKLLAEFGQRLLAKLTPDQGGLVFDPIRRRALEGSEGSTDFGFLFLGFSFFLIAAALLLVGLLVRLNLERRSREVGLLMAVGYRRKKIRGMLLAESLLLSLAGGLLGLGLAYAFSWGMLELLQRLWPGGLDNSFLHLHAQPLSLLIGYAATVIVSLFTIVWALRLLGSVSPPALLAGIATDSPQRADSGKPRWSFGVAVGSLVGALLLCGLGFFLTDHESRASTFLCSGMLLLTAGLASMKAWMRPQRASSIHEGEYAPLARLGIRNASRYPTRSLLTAGLLASATFLVVAVEAFHRDSSSISEDKKSGTGGFNLVAEADVPLYADPNTPQGLDDLNLTAPDKALLTGIEIYPFRLHSGDDTSCLNLYQARNPRLLGVSKGFIERGGFLFSGSVADDAEAKANPWLLLDRSLPDGVIPVIADATTATYMLHSGLGKEITVPNGEGLPTRLRIVGLLQDSLFQGELLISNQAFLQMYPRQEGFSFFLLDVPQNRAIAIKRMLENTLADHGFSVMTASARVASYLAVENTYLATFQVLGALGLLLGAIGLAIVLLRSVWERRAELALLRALGFRKSALGRLILAENCFLLLMGLAIGTLAALIAVAPGRFQEGGALSWSRLALFLAAVLLAGGASIWVATITTLRAPLLTALRRE